MRAWPFRMFARWPDEFIHDCKHFLAGCLPHGDVLGNRLIRVDQLLVICHPGGMLPGRREQGGIDLQRRQPISLPLDIGIAEDIRLDGQQFDLLWLFSFLGLRGGR